MSTILDTLSNHSLNMSVWTFRDLEEDHCPLFVTICLWGGQRGVARDLCPNCKTNIWAEGGVGRPMFVVYHAACDTHRRPPAAPATARSRNRPSSGEVSRPQVSPTCSPYFWLRSAFKDPPHLSRSCSCGWTCNSRRRRPCSRRCNLRRFLWSTEGRGHRRDSGRGCKARRRTRWSPRTSLQPREFNP